MTHIRLGILAFILGSLSVANAQNTTFFSEAGLRLGQDIESEVELVSYELFAAVPTDWSWSLSEQVTLNLDIELAIGGLSGEGETAAYGRIAPRAQIEFGDFPIGFVISSGPSLYSEDEFDEYDLGSHFHFTSSIGFDCEIVEDWVLSYRLQHTSNADLDSVNPGLDMHTLAIAHRF